MALKIKFKTISCLVKQIHIYTQTVWNTEMMKYVRRSVCVCVRVCVCE